jgi:hypothetical protein
MSTSFMVLFRRSLGSVPRSIAGYLSFDFFAVKAMSNQDFERNLFVTVVDCELGASWSPVPTRQDYNHSL